MAIVARGLGQPEDGALVVGGLGTVEVDPNAMSATLTGTSIIMAELTADSVAPSTGGGGKRHPYTYTLPPKPIPRPAYRPFGPFVPAAIVAPISARLSAKATLTADIDGAYDFDAELEELLLVGAL